MWHDYDPQRLLTYCTISDAVRVHAKQSEKNAAVYHSLPTHMFRGMTETLVLLQRWANAQTKISTQLPTQEKMLVVFCFRRLENRVVSMIVPMVRGDTVDGHVVAACYDQRNVVAVAMDAARQPISYQKVSKKAHKEHQLIKVVRCNLTARFNMVKEASRSRCFAVVILHLCGRRSDGTAIFRADPASSDRAQHFDIMAMVRSRGLEAFMKDLTVWEAHPSDAMVLMPRALLSVDHEALDVMDHMGPSCSLFMF